jgi:uncharacterized phage-associated protein
MNIPIRKLKAILLYFTNNTDTTFLGKVKLMKLFYFLDFTHLKTYGSPVTYDIYVNLEHGPIPSFIKNLVDNATDNPDESILTDTIRFEIPKGTQMCRCLPKRKFSLKDKKYFSETELEILAKICARFGDKNTKYIEDASHDEAPWKNTNLLDKIPYELATKDSDCLVSEEEITLGLQLFS